MCNPVSKQLHKTLGSDSTHSQLFFHVLDRNTYIRHSSRAFCRTSGHLRFPYRVGSPRARFRKGFGWLTGGLRLSTIFLIGFLVRSAFFDDCIIPFKFLLFSRNWLFPDSWRSIRWVSDLFAVAGQVDFWEGTGRSKGTWKCLMKSIRSEDMRRRTTFRM